MMILPSPRPVGGSRSSLLTSLVSYWKLEEASGTRVDQLAANDLTAVNTPGNTTGIIGNAVALVAASTQYLKKTSSTFSPQASDSFSVACWFRCTSFADYRTIIRVGDTKIYLLIEQTTGHIWQWPGKDYGATTISTWYHMVYTVSSTGVNTGTETLYLNGSSAGTRTGALGVSIDNTLGIGAKGDSGLFPFSGTIDECGCWNRVLTGTEINNLYNGGIGITYPFSGAP